jgi:hypothetical protein
LRREPDRREITRCDSGASRLMQPYPIRLARISPRPNWNSFFLDDAAPLWQVSHACCPNATASSGESRYRTFYQGKRLLNKFVL